MKISYECSDLIEELKKDIEEFGDIEMYAFWDKVEDFTFITNYDFIIEEEPLSIEEFESKDTIVQIMKASKILEILEEQNKIM